MVRVKVRMLLLIFSIQEKMQFLVQSFIDCHKVFEEAIIPLLDENHGRFKISRLDTLLISSFSNIIKEILTSKVREVVTKHQDELEGCVTNEKTLKEKELLDSITKCMKDLRYKVEAAGTIKDTVLSDSKKPENSITPLSDIIINILAQGREKSIVNKANTLELVSKMSNEFLSQNREICPIVSEDECQFNGVLISEIYGGVNNKEIGKPKTSMSRTNSTQS
ncbi:MAG: hypothetical protein PG981_000962 [Wolbachia endosymbiont of Ctenocephalides orientis wCori]|nr:MAG: hypothetical protein PG981_000962 [Wolbachia endosymbiont of Ctenocephalides orientis wCori]